MSFSQVARSPVYRQVADQLREAILEGRLAAGEPLPPERALAESFGVGRASVREAIRALQSEGLVVGAGSSPLRPVVTSDLSEPLRSALANILRLRGVSLEDLVELRMIIESAGVRRAAERQPADCLAEAADAIAAMKRIDDDIEAFDSEDVRFHIALVRASGNEALYPVMLAIRDTMARYLLEALQTYSDPRTVIRRLTGDHAAILRAVEAGRPNKAAELMRAHITTFYART